MNLFLNHFTQLLLSTGSLLCERVHSPRPYLEYSVDLNYNLKQHIVSVPWSYSKGRKETI